MFVKAEKAIPCAELLAAYEAEKTIRDAHRIQFLGVDGYDVYNITPDFEVDGKHYIAGRVEKRDTEFSMVRFFEKTAPYTYQAVLPEMTFKHFQDPCVAKIHGEIIIGGVQIIADPLREDKIVSWHTCFYRGKTLSDLRLFAIGPSHMKDIRLVEMADGRIGIFSRPQGRDGGKGTIGFIAVDTLDDVGPENILDAKLFRTHFIPEEWGGANEIHLLSSGLLGVVGHISCSTGSHEEGNRQLHYQSMFFVLDPKTMTHTPVKIIARRGDMSKGPSKRPDLVDVLFTGGLTRNGDGTATLYTGVSDCEAYCATIDDPFLPYEA